MVLIKVRPGVCESLFQDSALHPALHTNATGILTVEADSIRLFDVCNAFIDAVGYSTHARPISTSAIDAAVFGLIESGAIPQVPALKRGEIMEFIQKITFALSSVSRLAILRELHANPLMRATVAILEMTTGISEQTLRRHLTTLINCRLLKRTRIGQTYLYESVPMRLATLTYLWNALNQVE